MARDEGINAGTVVLSFVLGAIAGAAIALLWAPASGEETRRLLREKAQEGKEKAADLTRQGRELLERQRESVAAAIDRGREAYQQTREKEQV